MPGSGAACQLCGGLCSHGAAAGGFQAYSYVDPQLLYLQPFKDTDGDGRFTAKVEFITNFSPNWKEAILSALDIWESVTNIDFSTHLGAPENGVTFEIGSPSAGWGIAYDNSVIFNGSTFDEYKRALALHEIGHVIGLWHRTVDSVMTSTISSGSAPTSNDLAVTDALYGPKSAVAGPSVQAGGAGSQEVIGNAGSDILYGNQGSDNLRARGGDDTLFGGQNDDLLDGAAGADVLYGNLGTDVLSGGDGADTLYGGQAGDTLWGGNGDDLLFGNLGADLFLPSAGVDTVAGFNLAEGDRLSGAPASIADQGAGALVTFADGSAIVLIGVRSDELGGAFV